MFGCLSFLSDVAHRFNISYQLAEDYPVDLYFLMDLSNSMDTHKTKLSKLGQLLASSMRSITRNFRLGFGSFVEKETLPFVNTAPRSLNNPCMSADKKASDSDSDDGQSQCVPPYGYIHHMTLTDNSTLFEQEVTAAKVSGNLDSPEGGLDALMQAIVCEVTTNHQQNELCLTIITNVMSVHFNRRKSAGAQRRANSSSSPLTPASTTPATASWLASCNRMTARVTWTRPVDATRMASSRTIRL